MPAEQLTQELQQKKAERLARVTEGGASEASSLRDGDAASLSSFQTGSFMHTSQLDNSQERPRRTKAQLWNDLKITSITRAFTLIYSISLLILLTRIQLNLLGRLNYLSSVVELSQPLSSERTNSISLENHEDRNLSSFGNDYETNRRFLTFSWYLLHRGYATIMASVRTAVEEVFGSIPPTEGLSQQRLSDLVLAIRKKVEGSNEQERYAKRWLPYILPPREEEGSLLVESGIITPPSASSAEEAADITSQPRRPNIDTSSGPLRRLLDEASDLIDSPSFSRLHILILDAMFSHLIDKRVIAQLYPQPNTTSPPPSEAGSHPRIQELDSAVTVVPRDPQAKLASILAVLTRQAHAIGNGTNPPNEYLAAVESDVRELDSFAAVIYTSNLEKDVEQYQVDVRARQQGLQSMLGTAVSSVHPETVDEMVESKLESAWEKVAQSSLLTR